MQVSLFLDLSTSCCKSYSKKEKKKQPSFSTAFRKNVSGREAGKQSTDWTGLDVCSQGQYLRAVENNLMLHILQMDSVEFRASHKLALQNLKHNPGFRLFAF